jgi:hypothetical protein
MVSFFKGNIVLILALSGAVISFLMFLTEKIAKQHKVRILIMLAAMGFLILTGQQLIDHLKKKNRALLDEARAQIVNDIQVKVTRSLSLLKQLSTVLKGASPEKIGIGIVQSMETNQVLEFSKGPPSAWRAYADWLQRYAGVKDKVTSLSLTVGAGRRYDAGLLLAYLLTNPQTQSFIGSRVIERGAWETFPTPDFISSYGFAEPSVGYVLFYYGEPKRLVGFANARLFVRELLLYVESGRKREIEEKLNRRYPDAVQELAIYFQSFRRNVADVTDAYMTAVKMLKEKTNEMVVLHEGNLYFVNLTNIVQIVS